MYNYSSVHVMDISHLVNYSEDCTSVAAVMPNMKKLAEMVTVESDDVPPMLILHLSGPVLE